MNNSSPNYLFLQVFFLISLSLYCQNYDDEKIFQDSDYGKLLTEINDDFIKDSLSYNIYLGKLIALNPSKLNHRNDTLQLYYEFMRIKIGLTYTTGLNSDIEEYFEKYKRHAAKSQIKSTVNLRAIQAIVYYYKSLDDLEQFLHLIEFLTENKNLLLRKDYNSYLATLYYETLQYDKTIEIYEDVVNNSENKLHNSSILNNIGLAYINLGNKEKAIENYNRSLKVVKQIMEDSVYVNSLTEQGNSNFDWTYLENFKLLVEENLHSAKHESTSKEQKLKNLLLHAKEFKRYNKVISIDHFYEIALLYSNLNEFEHSNQYLDTINTNFRRTFSRPNMEYKIKQLRVYNNLKLGKIDLALKDLSLDTVSSNSTAKILALKNYQQNNFNKEKNQILITNLKTKLIGSLVFLIVVSIISFYAYKTWKKKKKQQKKAEYRQQQLAIVKKESDFQLQEANHRIMNSIQLVANMASLEQMNGEEKFDTQAFQLKMMSIAELHKLMYQEKQLDGFTTLDYFTEIINLLSKSLSLNNQINLKLSEESSLGIDTLNNLGLIIVELVINSIKHSHLEVKDICLDINIDIQSSHQWTLDYKDNGKFNYQKFMDNSNYSNSITAILIQSLSAKYRINNLPYFSIEISKKPSK